MVTESEDDLPAAATADGAGGVCALPKFSVLCPNPPVPVCSVSSAHALCFVQLNGRASLSQYPLQLELY